MRNDSCSYLHLSKENLHMWDTKYSIVFFVKVCKYIPPPSQMESSSLMPNINLSCCNLGSLIFYIWRLLLNPPLNLFFFKLHNPSSSNISLLVIFLQSTPLSCCCSSELFLNSMHLFWNAVPQNWTQYSRDGLTSVEYSGRIAPCEMHTSQLLIQLNGPLRLFCSYSVCGPL